MTLRQQQSLFCRLVADLILYAYSRGDELTFGEALRTEAQANANATSGAGISNSLHKSRLAIDLLLFKGGVYQTDSEAYRELGDYWKSLHPLNCWGGDFKKQDGNHFSSTRDGIK